MRYSDIHTHSNFSDGVSSPEENVLSAIEKNMLSLGFSDHGYTFFDTSYCIQKNNQENYRREIRRLADKYKSVIEIYLGIEADGFATLDNREEYDYIIGDCHYIATPDGNIPLDMYPECTENAARNYFGGDFVAMAVKYFYDYADAMRALCPDVLGHIDLPTKFSQIDEEDPRYISASAEALVASLEAVPVIELNTGAISRGWRNVPYPSVRLLSEIKAHGGKILLSSDSHSAKNLAFGFDNAVELLKSVGINSIVALSGGAFNEFGI